MKNNPDSRKISVLYEKMNHKSLDYIFLENTDSFDWSQFHKEYNLQKFYIFEAFEHILVDTTSDKNYDIISLF